MQKNVPADVVDQYVADRLRRLARVEELDLSVDLLSGVFGFGWFVGLACFVLFCVCVYCVVCVEGRGRELYLPLVLFCLVVCVWWGDTRKRLIISV
jgi:hypothetical protein